MARRASPLGGRVGLARVRDDPGAERARRLDVAHEAVDRHRGDDHYVGAAPARRGGEGPGPRPPHGIAVMGRCTPGRPRVARLAILEAGAPCRAGGGLEPLEVDAGRGEGIEPERREVLAERRSQPYLRPRRPRAERGVEGGPARHVLERPVGTDDGVE